VAGPAPPPLPAGFAGREPEAARDVRYEDAEKELVQIVERLERGDAGLDEALQLWQRGEELYRFCVEQLDTAEGKIEELAKRVDAARPTT
jgi:exodeoxyribonuclease VII small subunit